MDRYEHIRTLLGDEVFASICEANVLCVGAGGIGCELLKNLVLVGFKHIEVIDLDTIDVSNLNRQLLFRGKHVGLPKSLVASEEALRFNPDVCVRAHHGNVKDKQFSLEFFKKFDIVFNALDNVNARQHVNRLCLGANVPLIDGGTTGYLGQTTVIKKGETPCYDCQPKTENRITYPICTVRNTPDKPVHCIVWAKELYKLMFGQMEESMLFADESLGEADEAKRDDVRTAGRENIRKTEIEVKSAIMNAVSRPKGEPSDCEIRDYVRGVFRSVFETEILLKLQLRDGYVGAKFIPKPLSYDDAVNNHEAYPNSTPNASKDHRILTISECVKVFEDSVVAMYLSDRRKTIGDCQFDKDDEIAMDFVAAAASIRAHVFGIERQSRFATKGIAGNIIHAIAATNAIVAGLQVMEGLKLLASNRSMSLLNDSVGYSRVSKYSKCSGSVWVVREPIAGGYLLQSSSPGDINEQCVSCGNALVCLSIDTDSSTLGFLVKNVLKEEMGVNTPTIMVGPSEVYAEGDGLDSDEIEEFQNNLLKPLISCPAGGIGNGALLDVEDFSQNLTFKIAIVHKSKSLFEKEKSSKHFTISGDTPMVKSSIDTRVESEEVRKPLVDKHDLNNEIEIFDAGLVSNGGGLTKKKRIRDDRLVHVDDGNDHLQSKRPKEVEDSLVHVIA